MVSIFGIFDVLGFKSFCENCDLQETEKVLKVMDEFETDIPKVLMAGLDTKNTTPLEKREQVTSRLKWLIFSDTIFVAMPIDLSDKPDKLKFNLIFFAILVAYINRRMFEIGLPVRGAVHIGDVIVSKRCFAGKAIVETYRLGQSVQVAGSVISEAASTFVSHAFPDQTGFHEMFKNLFVECEVSTGNNSSGKFKTLCWFYLKMGLIEDFNSHIDLDRFVTVKFTAHGKKLLGEKEERRVSNTVKLFREWQIANYLMTKGISPPEIPSIIALR